MPAAAMDNRARPGVGTAMRRSRTGGQGRGPDMNGRIVMAPLVLGIAAMAAGCRQQPEPLLGTLEWDRISLPAPAAERIVALDVREGDQVRAGTRLLRL